ncbi:UNVERIFIED_CONTAM: hypothetical protein Scaly_0101300, partial [Sesamum calycinum]
MCVFGSDGTAQNVVVALCTEGDAEVALQKWGDLASPPFRHPLLEGTGPNPRGVALDLGDGGRLDPGRCPPPPCQHRGDVEDGTEVQLKSVTLNKYVSADNGGGATIAVDRDFPQSWETFRLWRVSETIFQFRTSGGQFLTCDGDGGTVTATAESASSNETFYIERNNDNRVHIKLKTGTYLQASKANQLTADYPGTPGWMIMLQPLIELHQISCMETTSLPMDGRDKAEEVLKKHRNSFISVADFNFLYRNGINTVRIPVG